LPCGYLASCLDLGVICSDTDLDVWLRYLLTAFFVARRGGGGGDRLGDGCVTGTWRVTSELRRKTTHRHSTWWNAREDCRARTKNLTVTLTDTKPSDHGLDTHRHRNCGIPDQLTELLKTRTATLGLGTKTETENRILVSRQISSRDLYHLWNV